MALDDTFNITRPGQQGATGAVNALHVQEYSDEVEASIARKSALDGWIKVDTVTGTSTINNFSVGESTLQKVVPGVTPDGTVNKFGKASLAVDTIVLARSVFPLLEDFQTKYNARMEVAREHGKKIAKFWDQSFFIQAIKAGLLTSTNQLGQDVASGFKGGNQKVLASASDALDSAKLYSAVVDLLVQFEKKDVDPLTDDVMLVVRPDEYAVLEQNELLIDRNYITSEGNSIQARVLKARGVPVINSNNFPGAEVITGHYLSNASNGNAYDGDFTKVVAAAFSPRALLAGQTIPLTTKVHYSDVQLQWFVDAYLSYAVGPNRPEFAGVILKP